MQVVPNAKNDPIRKLDEMTLEDWAEQEMKRLMQMSEDDILRELLGEDILSAKAEPQPDGTICRTKDCKRHKGLTREHKIKTKPVRVKYKDARCERADFGDGQQLVKVRKPVKNTQEAIGFLSQVMNKSVKLQNGKMRGVPGAGAKAPDLNVEFYLSNNSIRELVKNTNHSNRSASLEAHLSAAATIDQLWAASEHVWQRRDKRIKYEQSNIEWVYRRRSFMLLAGKEYEVTMTAKQFKNGNNDNVLYDLKVQKSRRNR